MGQLRSSLATLLLAGLSPGRALELLEGFAASIDGARVSTAACLVLDPATGALVYSRAGHPPPLLAERSGATLLDDGLGPALCIPGGGARPEAVATLPPGATLLLFTDGLIEVRGSDLDDGLERLAATVLPHASAPLDDLVDRVLAELIDLAGADDDIAVVAVRPRPAPLHLELPADPVRLAQLRRAVATWATTAALGAHTTDDLQLAVGEAAANVVEHAYPGSDGTGPVVVDLLADREGVVTATVRDHGVWRPSPADPGFRGRGLQMIGALARDVDLDRGPDGTVVRFRLPPAAAMSTPSAALTGGAGGEPTSAALTVTDAGARRCLELAGDLDLAGVESVRGALLRELAADRPVTLDLTRLGYVSSVGAGLLLEAVQAMDAGLEVVLPVGVPARRLLDLAGVTPVLQRTAQLRPR